MHIDLEESLRSAVESYRATLLSVGEAGARAFPPTGDDLKQSLSALRQPLLTTAAPEVFAQTGERAGQELKAWGDCAFQYYTDSTQEIKILLLQVAEAVAKVGSRDQRYGEHLQGFAQKLQGAAALDTISAMRQSLSSSAVELVNLVTQMTEDGKQTVEQLRGQISAYEERVQEAERQASMDPLTGVSNRRAMERRLERSIAAGSPFFVVYLDLNEFKLINDTLGHLAGDDLLKQFAGELSHCVRSTDLVGRMGGDEFLVVVSGAAEDPKERIAHIQKQVNGSYTLPIESGKRKVEIHAAAGIAAWKPGISGHELLSAADAAMYENKKRMAGTTHTSHG